LQFATPECVHSKSRLPVPVVLFFTLFLGVYRVRLSLISIDSLSGFNNMLHVSVFTDIILKMLQSVFMFVVI